MVQDLAHLIKRSLQGHTSRLALGAIAQPHRLPRQGRLLGCPLVHPYRLGLRHAPSAFAANTDVTARHARVRIFNLDVLNLVHTGHERLATIGRSSGPWR